MGMSKISEYFFLIVKGERGEPGPKGEVGIPVSQEEKNKDNNIRVNTDAFITETMQYRYGTT